MKTREIPQRKGVRRDRLTFVYKTGANGREMLFPPHEYYDQEQDQILLLSKRRSGRSRYFGSPPESEQTRNLSGFGFLA